MTDAESELADRLVIIGNAEVPFDASDFVNHSRHVMRFNQCPNYDRNTGTRTTILNLINHGVVGRDLYKRQSLRGWPPAEQAGEIWFRAWKRSWLETVGVVLRHHRQRKRFLDYGAKILNANAMQSKTVRYLPKRRFREIQNLLHNVDPDRPWEKVRPTTGFLGIQRALADSRFHDLPIYLLGFTWELGGEVRVPRAGHTWDEEEILCRGYHDDGRLTILDESKLAEVSA